MKKKYLVCLFLIGAFSLNAQGLRTLGKKIMHLKGILNIGGPSNTVYKFAKRYNKNIKKKYLKKNKKINLPLNASMNLSKLKKLIS